jgi:hypothetical protein
MGSNGVGIGCVWCFWKVCEIFSSLIYKKKLEKKYSSSYKVPKLQWTSFWSQGILGVKTSFEQNFTMGSYIVGI